MLKVILVVSGKGGTGKTSLTAGVGAALSGLGRRVLLIDGDCGLRNLWSAFDQLFSDLLYRYVDKFIHSAF